MPMSIAQPSTFISSSLPADEYVFWALEILALQPQVHHTVSYLCIFLCLHQQLVLQKDKIFIKNAGFQQCNEAGKHREQLNNLKLILA